MRELRCRGSLRLLDVCSLKRFGRFRSVRRIGRFLRLGICFRPWPLQRAFFQLLLLLSGLQLELILVVVRELPNPKFTKMIVRYILTRVIVTMDRPRQVVSRKLTNRNGATFPPTTTASSRVKLQVATTPAEMPRLADSYLGITPMTVRIRLALIKMVRKTGRKHTIVHRLELV